MRLKRNRKISALPLDECRVCLGVGADVALFSNIDDTKTTTELLKILMECTSVMVCLDDQLPKKLCVACVRRLQDAQRLKELAQSSDKLLRQKYGLLDIELPANSEKDASLLYTTFDVKEEMEDDVKRMENGNYSLLPTHDSSSEYEPPKVKRKKKKLPINRPPHATKGRRMKLKTFPKNDTTKSIKDIKQEHRSDNEYPKVCIENEVVIFIENKTECKENIENYDKTRNTTSVPKSEKQADNEVDVKINKHNIKDIPEVPQKRGPDKKYHCPDCPEKFSRKRLYGVHIRRYHRLLQSRKRVTKKMYKCHMCPEEFGQQRDYNKHMRTAHKLRGFGLLAKYMCHQCGKIFNQSYALRDHTGCVKSEEFPCNICGKIFKRQILLTKHITYTHMKIKPFNCELCPMKFCTKSLLRLHTRSHTGEKPHACSYCGRRFLRKGVLLRHILTHTGRKPCSCKHCDQRFSAALDVKAHVRRMHKGEPLAKVSDYCRYVPEESNNMIGVIQSLANLECVTSQLGVQKPGQC